MNEYFYITILILIALILLCYVVYITLKMREIITRLTIIDTRLRVMEPLLSNPDVNDSNYSALRQHLYEKFFGDLYAVTYDEVVRLSRKHDMGLSLKTSEEIKKKK